MRSETFFWNMCILVGGISVLLGFLIDNWKISLGGNIVLFMGVISLIEFALKKITDIIRYLEKNNENEK